VAAALVPGGRSVSIADRFPLDDTRTAHECSEAGGLLGKVLITL
jgi:hypothetical protein